MAQRSNALSAVEGCEDLVYSGFRLQARSVVPIGRPTREQWLTCLAFVYHLYQHVEFWLADLLAYGSRRWKVTLVEMMKLTGYNAATLRNMTWVANRVGEAQRRENLSFSHHQEVARLTPPQQERVLARAESHGWTRDQVRQEAFRIARSEKFVAAPKIARNPSLRSGDCRKVLAALPDASVDLLVSDPPYGLDYVGVTRVLPFPRMANDGEEACQVLDDALSLAARKLKANSHIYIFTSWKTYRGMAAVVSSHFTLCNVLIWKKNNCGVGDLEGGYGEQQEVILFAQKGRRPLAQIGHGNVLCFDRVGTNQLQHPTQKPVPLLEYIVGQSSDAGGLVLDPFMGSGSTCVAARNLGRRYLGIEIEQQWYDVALQRLA